MYRETVLLLLHDAVLHYNVITATVRMILLYGTVTLCSRSQLSLFFVFLFVCLPGAIIVLDYRYERTISWMPINSEKYYEHHY